MHWNAPELAVGRQCHGYPLALLECKTIRDLVGELVRKDAAPERSRLLASAKPLRREPVSSGCIVLFYTATIINGQTC